MLQQTQVATVIPYFERFLARFPTVQDLAAAPLDDVLSMWRGLGYYSRARNLHRAAVILAKSGFPQDAAGLRELPGFGRYTAAAVASLALGEQVAVLDGNVARVLSRLTALEGPAGDRENEKKLWALAEERLDPSRPGDFNEAMMELGALICAPRNPTCLLCPVAKGCEARRRGLQDEIPAPKVRAARKKLELACAVVVEDGRVLLARREGGGLFGGLWELPCVTLAESVDGVAGLAAAGLVALDAAPLGIVSRTLTHRDLRLQLYRCAAPGKLSGYTESRSLSVEDAALLGMSKAMSEALAEALSALARPANRQPKRAPRRASK